MHKRAKLRLDIASRIAGGCPVESPHSTVEWAWQRAGMLINIAEAWSLDLETAEADLLHAKAIAEYDEKEALRLVESARDELGPNDSKVIEASVFVSFHGDTKDK